MNALAKSQTKGEFSVVWFDPNGKSYYEKQFCGPEEAYQTAGSLTRRPAAIIGIIRRVIITDAGDCTNFEWTRELGQVYPEVWK